MTHIVPGAVAPGFSLKDLAGRTRTLSSLTQQGPVVAAFFKISCPVCQFTFPFLERLHQRYGATDVAFVGISQDDARATAKFAKDYNVTFPMALDTGDYTTSNAYGLTNVPTTFLVHPDGVVKLALMGFDKNGLEEIGAYLAERQKIAPTPLFRPGESVPAHKPG